MSDYWAKCEDATMAESKEELKRPLVSDEGEFEADENEAGKSGEALEGRSRAPSAPSGPEYKIPSYDQSHFTSDLRSTIEENQQQFSLWNKILSGGATASGFFCLLAGVVKIGTLGFQTFFLGLYTILFGAFLIFYELRWYGMTTADLFVRQWAPAVEHDIGKAVLLLFLWLLVQEEDVFGDFFSTVSSFTFLMTSILYIVKYYKIHANRRIPTHDSYADV